MKKLLVLLMLSIFAFANNFQVNDNIGTFSLPNQHDEKVTVDANIETILVSFEKGTSGDLNDYLKTQKKGFLENNKAVFIADISGMPSIITKLFALPKMRDYNYNVLLIYDEDNRFLKQEGKLTQYKLENGVIKSISYISKEDIAKAF